MKSNDIFNIRRFGRYFATDFRSGAANYGLSLLTLTLLTPVALYVLSYVFSFITGNGLNGPGMGLRAAVFGISMFCLVITMPVKCYGRLTEKQYGSFWLTLPASRLEKVVSMLILTCITAPLLGVASYLCLDALICALDSTCGGSLAYGLSQLLRGMGDLNGALADLEFNLPDAGITIEDGTERMFRQLSSPWLYIDEIFCITLPFLLGAICFRNGKTVKTFIAIAVFSTAVSIITTPIVLGYIGNIFNDGMSDIEAAEMFLNSGLIRNLSVIDMISDTVMNLALITGIWFRIKTLKH